MEKLTDAQILAADAILDDLAAVNVSTTSAARVWGHHINDKWKIEDVADASYFLKEIGFIEFITSKEGHQYMITEKGGRFRKTGKSISNYLQEVNEKEAEQLEKDKLEAEIKRLQRDDLHFKVTKLNPEQYQSYKDFWNRHWMTISISIVLILITLLTFISK